MRFKRIAASLALVVILAGAWVRADVATTLPDAPPAGLDAGVWQAMKAIDGRAGAIHSLTADFQQQKFTALLKKPLVSSGSLLSKGAVMVWHTTSSPATDMRIDDREVRLYYPDEKTEEIYPVGGQMSGLISSPIPRLAALMGRFSFAPIAAKELGAASETGFLALRMTPIDDTIKQHVKSVSVLLDSGQGVIDTFIVVDSDGDRTEIRFSNIRINGDIDEGQLQLKLPADVKVVHPLEQASQ